MVFAMDSATRPSGTCPILYSRQSADSSASLTNVAKARLCHRTGPRHSLGEHPAPARSRGPRSEPCYAHGHALGTTAYPSRTWPNDVSSTSGSSMLLGSVQSRSNRGTTPRSSCFAQRVGFRLFEMSDPSSLLVLEHDSNAHPVGASDVRIWATAPSASSRRTDT